MVGGIKLYLILQCERSHPLLEIQMEGLGNNTSDLNMLNHRPLELGWGLQQSVWDGSPAMRKNKRVAASVLGTPGGQRPMAEF